MQEWLNENSVRSFPLTSSDNLLVESLPKDFIVDLKLFLSRDATRPAFIKTVQYNNTNDSYYIEIASPSTNAIFVSGWVTRLDNGQQRNRAVVGASESVAIITPGNGWHEPIYGLTGSWQKSFSPSATLIEQSLAYTNPLVLKRILIDPSSVSDPMLGQSPPDTVYSIVGGFNMKVGVVANQEAFVQYNAINGNTLVIGSEEGAGLGYVPATATPPEDLTVKTINGKGPDIDGNMLLTSKDCVRVSQPIIGAVNPQLLEATLQVESDCVPCCGCQNFNNIALSLNRKQAALRDMGFQLRGIADNAIAKYNVIKNRLEARPPVVIKV